MFQNTTKLFLVRVVCSFVLFLTLSFAVQAAPGDLDVTFGDGGKVVTPFGDLNSQIQGLAIQSDGKIVAGGYSYQGANGAFTLVRYNTDGTLDPTFGNSGRVIASIGSLHSVIDDIKIQSDGKIVAAGVSHLGADRVFTLARLNPNGSFDDSFGTAGVVTTRMGNEDFAYALEIQPDGKIVVAGDTNTGTNSDFAVARYNPNGSLDNGFGTGGKVLTPISAGDDFVNDLAIQSDGKIIVSGGVDGGSDFALVRYNSDGSLDSSFGNGGKVVTPVGTGPDFAYAVVVQSDGKIVAVGDTIDAGQSQREFALVRYNSNGIPDSSFGNSGIVKTPINMGNGTHNLWAAALQSNGKIVAVGRVNTTGLGDIAVARYNPNGTLDSTFGNNGIVLTAIGGGVDNAAAVAIQPDGKIVAGGWRGVGGIFSFALARYHGDTPIGRVAFDFDGDGKADESVFRPSNGVWYLLRSTAGFNGVQLGAASDRITPTDYDGDGKTDVAVFRNGNWFILQSSNGTFRGLFFGQAGDVPVPFDYDGDRKADTAVYRAGIWYFLNSANNQLSAIQFGNSTDKPVPADYDGDGKTDVAVFRDGVWYSLNSGNGQFKAVQFGQAGDVPVPANYDGDSRDDQAVYRNGVWYLLRSTGGFAGIQFGVSTDIPTPADYDGDGKADVAVFRDGIWYRINSGNGQFNAIRFGFASDKPIPAAFLP